MKSTVKIAGENQAPGLIKPVIKIVQPREVIYKDINTQHLGEEDSRDDLINTFLQNPCNIDRNDWFKLGTHFPVPMDDDKPTHFVSHIEAVDERDLFTQFKNAILYRVIPYNEHLSINRDEVAISESRLDLSMKKHKKITEFFNWLDETGYCSWEERQPR